MKPSACRYVPILLITLSSVFLILGSCTPSPPQAAPQASEESPVTPPEADRAVVTGVAGSAFVLRDSQWLAVKPGFQLLSSDILRVTEGSSCEIQAGSGLKLAVGASSLVSLPKIVASQDSASLVADLLAGTVAAKAVPGDGGHSLTLLSGPAEIILTDGKAAAQRRGEETRLTAEEGALSIVTPEGKLDLQADQGALVLQGKAPEKKAQEGIGEDLLIRTESPVITDWREVAVARFTIRTQPGDAQIQLGGKTVGTGFYSSLLKVGSVLGFTVKKAGFSSQTLTVNSERDEEILVTLAPAPLEAGTGTTETPEDAMRRLQEDLSQALSQTSSLKSDLEAGREQLKTLDRERLDLNAQVQKLDQRSRQLEAQAEAARKEKEALAETLKRSEAQRKTLAEALSAKMKELQATLEANQ